MFVILFGKTYSLLTKRENSFYWFWGVLFLDPFILLYIFSVLYFYLLYDSLWNKVMKQKSKSNTNKLKYI